MTVLGPNDLKQKAIPQYIDSAELRRWQLRSGETYEQLVSDITDSLSMANGMLLTMPLIASLISTTEEVATEYAIGVSNGFEEASEYGRPEDKRVKTTGHMLPLKKYDRGMGWTWEFLLEARRIQIDSNIASLIADLRNIWMQKILTRLFKSTYDTVASGRSMPVADGGTADSAYIPQMQPDRAAAFDATHTHLGRLNGITQANLETEVTHVWEHGHDAPYDLLVSETDLGSWTDATSITGYVPRANELIRYGVTQDLATVDDTYHGVIETKHGPVRLRSNARIPTKYWSVYKSYGALDARNPLVVRYDPLFGIGAVLLAGDHIREFPLENVISYIRFGVGVQDRVGAALVYNHTTGSYTDPTIS